MIGFAHPYFSLSGANEVGVLASLHYFPLRYIEHMSEPGGFDRLSLNQQVDMIRSVSVMVAERQTAFRHIELYALDTLFIEVYFNKYRRSASVEKIKYINSSEGLQPYLEQITLPINHQ